MESTNWWNYVEVLIGEDTYSEAASKAGFDKSAFTRWKQGARADPDFVVKIARAYKTSVLEALVAADFITSDEAGFQDGLASTQLREAAIRTRNYGLDVAAAAIQLEQLARKLDAELEDEGSKSEGLHVVPESYAANRRTPEPEEGDDDYGSGA